MPLELYRGGKDSV